MLVYGVAEFGVVVCKVAVGRCVGQWLVFQENGGDKSRPGRLTANVPPIRGIHVRAGRMVVPILTTGNSFLCYKILLVN